MNQLPTFIEYLLLGHDYVVIPGLGTFIVQQMAARRNEEEEAFLPPYRSVRFNTELKYGDDLLVNAIEKLHKCTRNQAEQKLVTWVNEFTQTLEDTGYADFGALGSFTQEEAQSIYFTPKEAGVTTPDFYGLDAFHFSNLPAQPAAKVVPFAASVEANDKAITIRINRRIANIVTAACTIVLFFLAFNMSSLNTNPELRSSLKELIMPTNWSFGTHEAVEVQPLSTESETETPSAEEQEVEETGDYCIILACAISQENAEKYVATLQSRGIRSARVENTGTMLRVAVGYYQTESDAYQAVRELRNTSSEYQKAWVYHFQ